MKIIAKTKAILKANTAETIVEVMVAFVIMTLVMILFAEGIRFTTKAEKFSIGKIKDSNSCMTKRQNTINHTGGDTTGVPSNPTVWKLSLSGDPDAESDILKLTYYSIAPGNGGDRISYYVFDVN